MKRSVERVDGVPPFIDQVRQRVARTYGSAIGRPKHEIETPALILDLDATRRNVSLMAQRLRGLPASIRPHIKVHKSPDLARIQVEAGAIGVSTATVWEAVVMAQAGIDHILLANTVVSKEKVRVLAELARGTEVLVAIDDVENAGMLSAAARQARSTLGVLIEVDTGMDRAGVDTPEQALSLAQQVSRLPRLRLLGLTGYEGHCALTPERELRAQKQRAAIRALIAVADFLMTHGFEVQILSAGGTATWEWTASHPRVTEIQAGSYIVMDNFHAPMVDGFQQALTVLTTVISRPTDRVIVDAGSKSIGGSELVTVAGHDLPLLRLDEEHGVFVTFDTPLRIGDVVELIPGYAPSTVNWYDAYHVIENGVVVDIWPIIPRGPGHGGLLHATTQHPKTVSECPER